MFTSDAELLEFTKTALRVYMACYVSVRNPDGMPDDLYFLGKAKASIVVAVMRKFILLIPLIYILPAVWTSNQTMAVYMAEPIADALAVTFTAVLFAFQFKKALGKISDTQSI